MAKVKIQGHASGTGVITLTAPNTDTDRTITLPDESITLSAGTTTLGGLTDVSMDITNFADSILIQTDSDGSAPTTGTLSSASNNVGIGKDHTIFATANGKVTFKKTRVRTFVSVVPTQQ